MPADFIQIGIDQGKEDGKAVADAVKEFLCKAGVPRFVAVWIAGALGSLVFVGEIFFGLLFRWIILQLAVVVKALFRLISLFRKEGMQEFDQLTVESLSELLGVELDAGDIKPGATPEIALENARRIGAKLHARLIAEFTATGGGTPKSGEDAAQAFTGYVTRFAMMNSILSFLCDTVSLHHVTQARELGEEVAKNLGLGRMHRRAITPLIDNTISKPYSRELQARYRQDHLTDVQFVKAFQSGRLPEADMKQFLAYKGYPDSMIDELVKQLELRLSDSEIETLLRYTGGSRQRIEPAPASGALGVSDIKPLAQQDALQILVNQGMSEDLAKQRLVADSLKRADAEVSSYCNEIETLAYGGWMDSDQARAAIAAVPLSPEEVHWRLARFGSKLENPRRRLTLAQVRQAFIDGIVDLDYIDRWYAAEGYSDEDQIVLLYEWLLAAKKVADKEAAAAQAKSHVASKAKPKIP